MAANMKARTHTTMVVAAVGCGGAVRRDMVECCTWRCGDAVLYGEYEDDEPTVVKTKLG